MKQQINLYKTMPRISKNWFDDRVVLQIAVGFWALLGVVTIFQFLLLGWDKFNANSLQKKFIEANASFTKEQKLQGGFDLVQLQTELAEKTQLLNLLHIKAQTEGGCALLSDYFKSMSDAQTPGLWLTRFVIAPDSKDMTLEGQTYDPTVLINWLKTLGKTTCFAGSTFQTINVERGQDDATKNLMLFKVGSTHTPPPGGKK